MADLTENFNFLQASNFKVVIDRKKYGNLEFFAQRVIIRSYWHRLDWATNSLWDSIVLRRWLWYWVALASSGPGRYRLYFTMLDDADDCTFGPIAQCKLWHNASLILFCWCCRHERRCKWQFLWMWPKSVLSYSFRWRYCDSMDQLRYGSWSYQSHN